MADMTGFSFEGVGRALVGISSMERNLTPADFAADRLFGNTGGMADLYGIMLKIPQLARNLDKITPSGMERRHLAALTSDWVDGKSLQEIAATYFSQGADTTGAITDACKAIYRNLVNNGTWGLSALSRLAGIDFETLSDEQKRQINLLPAMIYHGVKTEEGVLMRMNGIPRTIAEGMGERYKESTQHRAAGPGVQRVRDFIASADIGTWNRARPQTTPLSAADYKAVWRVISGDCR